MRTHIALVGPRHRTEFAAVADSLDSLAAEHGFRLTKYDEPDEWPDARADSSNLDMFLFLQAFPGEYSQRVFDRARAASPLAVLVTILGPLCEGEGRTGSPPQGSVRLYHWQWESFGRPQLVEFVVRKRGRFTMPPTADDTDVARNNRDGCPLLRTDDDTRQTTFDIRDKPQGATPEPEVYIVAEADGAMARFVRDVCAKTSLVPVIGSFGELLRRDTPPSRIVIDSVDLSDSGFQARLRETTSRFPQTVVDVLAFSPRPEEIAQCVAYSRNCRVCAKPF